MFARIKKFLKVKKALEGETIVKWIIALVVLALCIFLIIMFSGKGNIIIEKIKSLFMFRS